MKIVFLFLVAVLALSQSNLVDLHIECPEQHVPDPNRICIKPIFIEGCSLYKNRKECDTCDKGSQQLIQIMNQSMENAVLLMKELLIPSAWLDASRSQMEHASIVPMGSGEKMGNALKESKSAWNMTEMANANCATLNTPSCMVNADTTSFWDAKWNFLITDAKNVLLLSNFKATTVASNTVKSTMTTADILVSAATTSLKTDHAKNTKRDA